MKNILLFLSCSLLISVNVLANDESSEGGDTPSKKSEACEEQKNANAFFLISSHSKEDVKTQIAHTRSAIDQCESNEEAEQLNKQIALFEEQLVAAPETGSAEDKKANPKDYTYGDFGEAPKKVDPDAPVPKPEVFAAAEEPVKKEPAKKAVAPKPKPSESEAAVLRKNQ
ncbi:MAG: hypothetical protein ABL930_11430 [Pseudobdellovibrio sp.]